MMILTVILAAVIGAVQIFLQNLAVGMLLSKRYLLGGAVVLGKAALYGVGIFVFLKFLRAFAVGAAAGFGAGFFVTLVVVLAVRISASRRREG